MGRGGSSEGGLGDVRDPAASPRREELHSEELREARALVEAALVGLLGVRIASVGIEQEGPFAGRPFIELHFEDSGHSFHGFRRLRRRPDLTGRETDEDWPGGWFVTGEDGQGHGIRLYPSPQRQVPHL